MSTQAVIPQATEQKPAAAQPSNAGLPYMTDAERTQWRTKGELPERFNGEKSRDVEQRENPLKTITPEQRDEWRRTGELPQKPASKKEPQTQPDAQQLSDLTPEQRQEWRNTGELPSKETPQTALKTDSQTTEPRTPQEVRARHEKNYTSLQKAAQPNTELGVALEAIHLKHDSKNPGAVNPAEVVVHALADLPPDLQTAVAKELASRPDVQRVLNQAPTREHVANAIRMMASHFAARQQEQETNYGFKQRIGEARKTHAGFDKVALAKDLPIAWGSVLDRFISTEEQGPEVLYYLAKNRDVLKEIVKLSPLQQHRRLIKIESLVSREREPAKTSASKPPREVGGRADFGDSEAAALERNDFKAIKRTWNKKALQGTGR